MRIRRTPAPEAVPAVPAALPPTARAVRRALPPAGQLRRERRSLLQLRETRLRDLGGLMLEMYRRDQFRQDLLVDRCVELVQLEERLPAVHALPTGGGSPRPTPCSRRRSRAAAHDPRPAANAERPSSGARSSAPSADVPSAQPHS